MSFGKTLNAISHLGAKQSTGCDGPAWPKTCKQNRQKCWSGMTHTEHSATSGSNEEEQIAAWLEDRKAPSLSPGRGTLANRWVPMNRRSFKTATIKQTSNIINSSTDYTSNLWILLLYFMTSEKIKSDREYCKNKNCFPESVVTAFAQITELKRNNCSAYSECEKFVTNFPKKEYLILKMFDCNHWSNIYLICIYEFCWCFDVPDINAN